MRTIRFYTLKAAKQYRSNWKRLGWTVSHPFQDPQNPKRGWFVTTNCPYNNY